MFNKAKEKKEELHQILKDIDFPPIEKVAHDLALRFVETDTNLKHSERDWYNAYRQAYKAFVYDGAQSERDHGKDAWHI